MADPGMYGRLGKVPRRVKSNRTVRPPTEGGLYRPVVIADGPIAYWRLGEASGTTAVDETGHGHDGTYVQGPTLGVTGLITDGSGDTAVQFSSSDLDHVLYDGTVSAFDVAAITVEAWIKTSSTVVDEQQIVSRDNGITFGAGQRFFQFRTDSTTEVLSVLLLENDNGTALAQLTGTTNVRDGVTHYVAFTYDGTDLILYLDGEVEASSSPAVAMETSSTAPVRIGKRSGDSPSVHDPFEGVIDEVAIYGRALTGTEIAEHWTAGTGGAPGAVATGDHNHDHGALTGRDDDDHTLYTKADGTRAFTGVVSGVTPTLAAHLATKGYADGLGGVTDHGALTGLSDDDHTQYLLAAGTRAATFLEVSGLTGATASSPRFVGGTLSGAPASGTFALGDYVVTEDGNIYVCTTAGTPGTWTAVGAGAATDADAIHDNVAAEISALTLVTAASGDHVLIEDASDSNNKKRVAASDFLGGSGSVFDDKAFIHTPAASAATEDDEFNDGTNMSGPVNGLDAKWTKRNLGTASWLVMDDAVAPGCLYLDIPTGQAADQAIYQTVPTGDFTIGARVAIHQTLANRAMLGLFVVDTSGNGTGIFIDNADADVFLRQVTSWVNGAGSTDTTVNFPTNDFASYAWPVWLTLAWDDTAETVTCGLSMHDRILVPKFTTTRAFDGTTIAHVGVGRIFGTGTGDFIIDSFRKLA